MKKDWKKGSLNKLFSNHSDFFFHCTKDYFLNLYKSIYLDEVGAMEKCKEPNC